jgi:hypothetical protein
VDAAVLRNVNPVKSVFLGGKRGFGSVEFEVAVFAAVELCETHYHRAFHSTHGDAFVAQGDDTQGRVSAETNEVARVDLDFQFAVGGSRDGVAFDQRVIQLGRFPVFAVAVLQAHRAFEHADAHDASFDVVIVIIIVVAGAGGDGN